MAAILQRVASASVTVDTQLISSIGKGVLVFAAVAPDDSSKEVESMAAKILKMKMWPGEAGGTVCHFYALDANGIHANSPSASGSEVYKISTARSCVVRRAGDPWHKATNYQVF